MKQKMTKLVCLFLCLLFCLAGIPACKKADPLAQNGIRSVNIIKKEKIEILVTLNSSMLKEHQGDNICLYELFPGEDLSSISEKQPVAEKKARASVNFKLPLKENDINRLYSSFVAVFSDGTLISEKACSVKNPEFLAAQTDSFPWAGAQKGLAVSDAEAAWEMGVSHALISLRLSELLNGTDTVTFNGNTYSCSSSCLTALDKQISAASNTGMQVSVELIPDTLPSLNAAAAMLELLSGRYPFDGSRGSISAWIISPSHCSVDAKTAAELTNLARLALRSRFAGGRVYLMYGGSTYSETLTYFSAFEKRVAELGAFSWGAMALPDCSQAPWLSAEGDQMTADKLPALFKFLSGDQVLCKPSYLAVGGLQFSAKDQELQAAQIAYAYQLSISSGATLVFYGDQAGEDFGLMTAEGTPGHAASVFEAMDRGLSKEDIAMVESLSLGAYSKLPESLSRKELVGSASLGSDGQKHTVLFDFSQDDSHGFTAVGGLSTPSCKDSASMGRPVLYTWLLAGSSSSGEGVRKILPSGEELENAFSISLQMLLQNLDSPSATVTLHLDGTSKNGSQRISFEASAELANDSRWQTAIFYIGSFVAEADLSKPCVLTLTVDSDAPEGGEYLLWLDSVEIRKPEKQPGVVIYLLIALGSVVIGFLLIFFLYRFTSKKRSSKRANYRR